MARARSLHPHGVGREIQHPQASIGGIGRHARAPLALRDCQGPRARSRALTSISASSLRRATCAAGHATSSRKVCTVIRFSTHYPTEIGGVEGRADRRPGVRCPVNRRFGRQIVEPTDAHRDSFVHEPAMRPREQVGEVDVGRHPIDALAVARVAHPHHATVVAHRRDPRRGSPKDTRTSSRSATAVELDALQQVRKGGQRGA